MPDPEQTELPGLLCPLMSRVVSYRGFEEVKLTEEERERRLQSIRDMMGDDVDVSPEDMDETEERPCDVVKLVKQACVGKSCALWGFDQCSLRVYVP